MGNNEQKCYDRSDSTNYPCITAASGKLSNADGSFCMSSCPSGKCVAGNFVCYSNSGEFASGTANACKCSTSYKCYVEGTSSTVPQCSYPDSTHVSNNDSISCPTTTSGCTTTSKCFHKDRTGYNICYEKAASPNLSVIDSQNGKRCTCLDQRNCIEYGSSQSGIICRESDYIIQNNLISRWSSTEYCLSVASNDTLECANNDQCWHPANRICTPHNAYGHSKGMCKMSQYILVLNNQIAGVGYEGEFHPVFIVNSFNDLTKLGADGLENLKTDIMWYYNNRIAVDYNVCWPDIGDEDYIFSHVRKTFTPADNALSGTTDTYEFWSFGGNTSHDQYQQELIKRQKYLWDWDAKNTGGYYMVFWYPRDTFMSKDTTNCWQDNTGTTINSNDIRPIFLKMRYFYKLYTAQKFYDQIVADDYPAYLIKPSFDGSFIEYGGFHEDSNKFIPQDSNEDFYISIREILMGFYSAKCFDSSS